MTAVLPTRTTCSATTNADVTNLDEEIIRHHRASFAWALACCHWDRAMAEDVLHSAYLKVLDGRARFRGESDFRGFLFGVIRMTATEEGRRRAMRALLPTRLFTHDRPEETDANGGLASLIHDERAQRLLAVLGQLPRRQGEVLHLVFYQDLSIAAAADVLGISVGSARVHYERGKARLRELLGDE